MQFKNFKNLYQYYGDIPKVWKTILYVFVQVIRGIKFGNFVYN